MKNFQLGACAVIFLVILRVAIGWHFLYEGLHKLHPQHNFSAKGFLGMAKGPASDLFYDLLPDLDGMQRLVIEPVIGEDGKPTKQKTFPAYEAAWGNYKLRYDEKYDDALKQVGRDKEADAIYNQYVTSLREMAADVESAVKQYRESYARFQDVRGDTDVQHVQQREWDTMMKYRSEAAVWLDELNDLSKGLQIALDRVYASSTAGNTGDIVTAPERAIIPNPIIADQMSLLNLSVALGLTAIGACLMLGLCSRLASLGGAAFLTSVWLSQFPWPTVYPPTPEMVGHFMLVSKDFIELIALLLIASLPVGCWGGLDYFIWHGFGKRLLARCPMCSCFVNEGADAPKSCHANR
ncbi:MAG: hypothetical protein ACRC46_11110 [Thermoguttaceae bacterium]